MASRSPVRPTRPTRLPDLPADLFGEDDELYVDRPVASPGRGRATSPSRPARAIRPEPLTRHEVLQSHGEDVVSAIAMSPEPAARTRVPTRQPRREPWKMPVMPGPGQMLEQALPNLLMAGSAALVLLLGTFTPLGIPVWAAGIFVPTVILALIATNAVHSPWKRAALINVATMAMIFPVLVIRQSVVRIPFVEGDNGTLLAPSIATAAVIALLIVLAVACAVLSQEDPEYSGIIFLPAAMMVPLLAGQTDIMSLRSALMLAAGIYVVASLLTVAASVLPGATPSLIAPAAIGFEFILLAIFQNSSTFPTGAGATAKVLFFVIVVATVALAILVPMMSVWVRQVTRIAQSSPSPA